MKRALRHLVRWLDWHTRPPASSSHGTMHASCGCMVPHGFREVEHWCGR
jgi:hypothetical protein